MNRAQLFDSFQLDDQAAANEEIEPTFPDDFTFIKDRNGRLSFVEDPPAMKFDGECVLIDLLQKARP